MSRDAVVTLTGAEALVRTLVGCGVDTAFTNPGTSEMHFVAALDRVPGMRCVLALFEGVATGAADGFGRMTGRPASTLLHLGPGLANGSANLHNARRALSPVVNIVGEHATAHRRHDAPLQSDIETLARFCSAWIKTVESPADAGPAAADAVAAALTPPGGISTLVLPADCAWTAGAGSAPVAARPVPRRPRVEEATIAAAADMLRKGHGALIVNGPVLRAGPLETCGRIAAATGAELLAPTQVPRFERGAGRVFVDRVPYVIDAALRRLSRIRRAVLVNAREPVAFFAYPDRPSRLLPPDCEVLTLADAAEDGIDALERLVERLGAGRETPPLEPLATPDLPAGRITLEGIAAVVAALLPAHAVVIDESITSGRGLLAATRNAPPHDWLTNPGGSIGTGLPLAIGAAVACPDRKVLCLESDGSAMYTISGLWTMARERLDVVTVVFNNRAYEILKGEFTNVGAGDAGQKARDMLEIDRPTLDFVELAKGQGVPGVRVNALETFARALAAALAETGPRLIELMI